ncbi:N-acetylglucosamine kinase-like BadF-type ATPase [Kutzneria viridogrisea]|uniref:N-acetylglucosamine kinase n=2 Tax=Kutzneria TaxID=43356 RepID=W5VY87_9PSEU|nr:BadF/BadG/BcrA/BcrD ATPase family protein [Kutzneria albida]AHH93848.1 N-acetylglucosamine kinase [Kutzneria albida DSM 43870]MBA8931147.1 N-acetylglucosamine kinase-like BadF-type ATPase [Kutzneria viridogrisea]
MADTEGYLVGVDAGGTSTRALVVAPDGHRAGFGRAGGANPTSHPPEVAADQVATAIRAALDQAGCQPAQVAAGVLGLAGSSKLADERVAGLFNRAWAATGLRCPLRVVTDCEAAFAAGTTEPDGTVLVAGTGSIAARIANHRQVALAGGYGWLLGDEGSSFWLGREAVRGTLRTLATGSAPGALARSVLAECMSLWEDLPSDPVLRRSVAARLITTVNGEAPIRLARFAPLVSAAASGGDPLAEEIITGAVSWLVRTVQDARSPGERTPVVLIGSLVNADTPLGKQLHEALAVECGASVVLATDGAAGAAWLAALDLLGPAAALLRAPMFG